MPAANLLVGIGNKIPILSDIKYKEVIGGIQEGLALCFGILSGNKDPKIVQKSMKYVKKYSKLNVVMSTLGWGIIIASLSDFRKCIACMLAYQLGGSYDQPFMRNWMSKYTK